LTRAELKKVVVVEKILDGHMTWRGSHPVASLWRRRIGCPYLIKQQEVRPSLPETACFLVARKE